MKDYSEHTIIQLVQVIVIELFGFSGHRQTMYIYMI